MVVHDVGEMVGGQVVGTLVEDFVVKDVGADGHLAADEIVDLDIAAGLNQEAHHVRRSLGYKPLHLFGRQSQGVAHPHTGGGVVLEIGFLCTGFLQFGGSVESDIGFSGVEQHFDMFEISRRSLCL